MLVYLCLCVCVWARSHVSVCVCDSSTLNGDLSWAADGMGKARGVPCALSGWPERELPLGWWRNVCVCGASIPVRCSPQWGRSAAAAASQPPQQTASAAGASKPPFHTQHRRLHCSAASLAPGWLAQLSIAKKGRQKKRKRKPDGATNDWNTRQSIAFSI